MLVNRRPQNYATMRESLFVFSFVSLLTLFIGFYPNAVAAEELFPGSNGRWSGLYVGGYLGHHNINTIGVFDAFEPGGGTPDLSNLGDSGLRHGGIQAGYNLQWNHIVMGVEVDASLGRFSQSYTTIQDGSASEAGLLSYPIVGDLNNLATVRGRLGFQNSTVAGHDLLFYLTAGTAFANFEMDIADGRSEVEFDAVGFVYGGGIEMALSDQWSLRTEYVHYEFDRRLNIEDVSVSGIFDANAGNYVTLKNIDVFRIGLNFKVN